MPKSERRHQLLDAAGALVVEQGLAATSMERVAERAGVSKALPYAHFDNVEALLVALYQREMVAVGKVIVAALDAAPEGADPVEVRVRAYLDAVEQRGEVIRALSHPGSAIPAASDAAGEGKRYTAGLLYRYHGVPKGRAVAISPIVAGTLSGTATAWLHGRASRAEAEHTAIAMLRAAIQGPEPTTVPTS